jgi:hypothetical protein
VSRRFSILAPFIGVDNPTSSAITTKRLRWKPAEISLLDDIEHGTYVEAQA